MNNLYERKSCLCCGDEMLTNSGKFGEFYYCPNQKVCGQKTITKNSASDSACVITKGSSHPLVYEMKLLEQSMGPLYSSGDENMNFNEDTGCYKEDDFRPYG